MTKLCMLQLTFVHVYTSLNLKRIHNFFDKTLISSISETDCTSTAKNSCYIIAKRIVGTALLVTTGHIPLVTSYADPPVSIVQDVNFLASGGYRFAATQKAASSVTIT